MILYEKGLDTAFTLVIVLVITSIAYFVAARKRSVSFTEWLGFRTPNRKSVVGAFAVGILSAPVAIGFQSMAAMQNAMTDSTSSIYQLANPEVSLHLGLATAALVAVLQTGFIEELFFRGLIAKRLFGVLSFWSANFIQATIFALVHVLFLLAVEVPFLLGIGLFFGFPLAMGLVIGYLDEKVTSGSFIPGWIVHSMSNGIIYSYWIIHGLP